MSANVVLIDTSVLCEILAVPGKFSDAERFRKELASMVKSRSYTLLLPMTTILETRNHIGQCSTNGGHRRKAAQDFVLFVGQAFKGEVPLRPTPFFEVEKIAAWLAEFPDWTMRSGYKGKGSGLGDLTLPYSS
jgi:hypothetical protein